MIRIGSSCSLDGPQGMTSFAGTRLPAPFVRRAGGVHAAHKHDNLNVYVHTLHGFPRLQPVLVRFVGAIPIR